MKDEMLIRQAYMSTLLDGGFTALVGRHPHPSTSMENPIINPDRGYVVGGAWRETLMPLTPSMDINYAKFKELWEGYADHIQVNWDRYSGIGTWVHHKVIYFDVVGHYKLEKLAMKVAVAREEIAIWDCENQREIPVTSITIAI